MDGFFAATALAKDLTLVTRNVTDLRHLACHYWDE
jgi:predicted nucleic acid-binding protein